ncbi:hypothetical protein KUCAC02_037869, partial [Chaenocephalus aceratus]
MSKLKHTQGGRGSEDWFIILMMRAGDFPGALVYLKKYGYLNAPLPSEGRRPPPREMKAALRVCQEATQLQVSGRVDAVTLRMMRNPRCGEEDPFRFHTYRVLGQVLAHADAPESGKVHFDSNDGSRRSPLLPKESFGTGGRSGPLRFPCRCCDVGPPAEDLWGGFVWTVSSSGLDPGLSAAVTSQRSGKTYFLKENRVWRYSGFKLDHGFPRKLSNIPANIDAAFYLSKSKKLIFIKGSGYWQWDETSTSGFSSFPRPLSHLFPGAPDAALASSDTNIFLFKGSQVWSVKLQKHVEKPRSRLAE